MREFIWRWRRTISLVCVIAVIITLLRLILPQIETKPVIVSAVDIPAGTTISANQLQIKSVPIATLPPQAFQKKEQAIGQRTAIPLAKGTTLFPALFSSSSFSRKAYKGQVILALPLRESDQGLVGAGDKIMFFLSGTSSLDTKTDSANQQESGINRKNTTAESPGNESPENTSGIEVIKAQALSVSEASMSLTGSGKVATIEVAVNPADAARLVQASKNKALQLARTG